MHTGHIWLKVLRAVRIELSGRLRAGTYAKDVIPHLVGELGIAGAAYEAVAFAGSAVAGTPLASRIVLANMVAEMRAKTALVDPAGLEVMTLPAPLRGRLAEMVPGEEANETTGRSYRATRMPKSMTEILWAAGLVAYLKAGGDNTVRS